VQDTHVQNVPVQDVPVQGGGATVPDPLPAARGWLPGRSVVLVGMPGSGKSSIGRRLALRLGLPFLDADTEIEAAAGLPITEIFSRYGEPHFRDGERRVITRLLAGPPVVLATGGGAFADDRTRAAIRRSGAISVWLRCRLPVLMRRVAGRDHRPMFLNADPAEVLQRLMTARHPLYAEADLVIQCTDESPDSTTRRVQEALEGWTPPARLPVTLGERSYDIVVGEGLLERAGALLAPVLPARRVVVVTDENVAPLHLPTLRAGLEEAGFSTLAEIIVPAGEASKNFAVLQSVLEQMLTAGADRRTTVVALGGGVVGDLAGFAAAILRRGVDFVQVPTSLLAQVDSSVGGKTGINSPQGKNLLGAFHQPVLVIADTSVLDTLSPRQFRAGYAEVAKYGVLGDEAFFSWLEANHADIFSGGAAREHAIATSCRAKAAIVSRDERENGERALLNLGHTFGHALEAATGFSDRLFHGEGVSVGMVLAAEFSAQLGMISQSDAARVERHLATVGLPTHLQDIAGFAQEGLSDADALMVLMAQDKKVKRGKLTFILLQAVGRAVVANDVEPALVRDFLQQKLSG
jgi:shikimate kinase / 3-dehydroquinate synthase